MRIVHISDLHFSPTTTTEQSEAAVAFVNEMKPAAIVCTGDIVSRDTLEVMTATYQKALAFRAALDCKTFLTVPGNHDLYDKEFNDIDLYHRLWAAEDTFSCNLDDAFVVGVNSGLQTDAVDLAHIPDLRARKAFTTAAAYIRRGDVQPEQVQFIQDAIRSSDLGDVRILALHHHLMPIYNPVYKANYNFDMVTNACDILEALRLHRFDIVLNGHKHCTQLNILNGVAHFTGGSMFLDLPEGEENSFNVLDLDEMIHLQVARLQSRTLKTLWCGPNPKFFHKQ